jgi:hypothetical protein
MHSRLDASLAKEQTAANSKSVFQNKKGERFYRSPFEICIRSIPIVPRLVRAFGRHAEVVSLFLRELGQLHADAIQVQADDFFVQFIGQTTNAAP